MICWRYEEEDSIYFLNICVIMVDSRNCFSLISYNYIKEKEECKL